MKRKSTKTFQGRPCPHGHTERYEISRRCVACTYARSSTFDERERRRARDRARYNLPEPTRPATTACECCNRQCHRALALDHDHSTGSFRGWLCFECNTGIGKLGDSIEGVKKALAYLERAEL